LPTAATQTTGTLVFIQANNGVDIQVSLAGLTPGQHGLHIHTYGDARAQDATSAGGHYNPYNTQHAAPTAIAHHIGDLGNITANADGVVVSKYTIRDLSLNGPMSIVGRSVIIHAEADDFRSQPSGAAGKRIAQGIIGIAAEKTP
jgi:Cu-Zn family superoxide dismutase